LPVFVIQSGSVICGERMMRGQPGFWDLDDRYVRLSAVGDPLEKLNSIIPRPVFEKPLAKALKRSDGSKGGRPAFPSVLMFKILVLQALYNLSDDQAEFGKRRLRPIGLGVF
jgi:IS5 family transposase